jgi:hypothetical protein
VKGDYENSPLFILGKPVASTLAFLLKDKPLGVALSIGDLKVCILKC